MANVFKYVLFVTLVWVVNGQMSADDVFDEVSTRLDFLLGRLGRIERRQNNLEDRLDALSDRPAANVTDQAPKLTDRADDTEKTSDTSAESSRDEDLVVIKKALTSEKEYIRAEFGIIEEKIANLNERLNSRKRTPKPPRNFHSRMPQANRHEIGAIGDLEDRIMNMKADLEATKMTMNALDNNVKIYSSNLSTLVQASERKVSFYAQFRPSGNYAVMMQQRRILFDHVALNDGLGYNASSGIFTAPVSGVYQFIFFVEGWTEVDDFSCVAAAVILAVNKKGVAAAVAEPKHVEQTIASGNTYVNHMEKGQEAWVQTATTCDQYSIFAFRTSFSGVLLY